MSTNVGMSWLTHKSLTARGFAVLGALLLVGLTLALCASEASAQTTTEIIDFDNVAPGVQITNQYPGLTFEDIGGTGFTTGAPAKGVTAIEPACAPPTVVRIGDNTNTPPDAASLECWHGAEFGVGYGMFAQLTDYADEVSAYVGDPWNPGEEFRLDAYDEERNLIGSSTVVTGPLHGIFTPISIKAPSFEIAYIALYPTSVPGGPALPAVDTIALSTGGAAPAISLSSPGAGRLAQGGKVTRQITVARHNGSEGEVVLRASGLPSGVSASFSPSVLTGTESTSTLTLSTAANAPLASASATIEAEPKTVKAGSATSTAPLALAVVPPFGVDVSNGNGFSDSTKIVEPPCSTRTVSVLPTVGEGFSGPVDLALSASGDAGDVASLTLDHPTGADPFVEQELHITQNGDGSPSDRFTVTVTPSSGSLTETPATVEVERDEGAVTSDDVAGGVVSAPTPAAAGTQVTLSGVGLCPGSLVAIGDHDQGSGLDNVVTPESIAPSGESLTFRVPVGAITGHIYVIPPNGLPIIVGPRLTVRSLRNTDGFSWPNTAGTPLDEQMVETIFGYAETHESFAWWTWRKWAAVEFEKAVNKSIANGLCFGLAYSTLEAFDGAGFPGHPNQTLSSAFGAAEPFDLPQTPQLLEAISETWALQDTENLIPAALNATIGIHGTNDDVNAIKQGLSEGQPVLIDIDSWSGIAGLSSYIGGHTVLAYAAQTEPNGSTVVDVVNSNEPYEGTEEISESEHDKRAFKQSQIIIDNGNWEFPEFGWRGSEASMVVYKHSELPIINGQRPTLDSALVYAALVMFGSDGDAVTQLTGGGGSLFAGGHPAPQGSWPKGVTPLAPLTGRMGPLQMAAFNPKIAAPLTATVARREGGGAMSLKLPGLQASLQTGAATGEIDHVSIDPRTDTVGYRTNAVDAAFGGTLESPSSAANGVGAHAASTPPSSSRVVEFHTTAHRGGAESVAFPAAREFAIEHSGPATTLAVTLSAIDASGTPVTVRLPDVKLAGAETLNVLPESWQQLGSRAIRLTILADEHLSSRRVRGRLTRARRFASIRRTALERSGEHRDRVAVLLAVRHAPTHAQLGVQVTVARHGRVLAQTRPLMLHGSALRSGAVRLALRRALPRGRYSLRTRLVEVTANHAGIPSSTIVTATGSAGISG